MCTSKKLLFLIFTILIVGSIEIKGINAEDDSKSTDEEKGLTGLSSDQIEAEIDHREVRAIPNQHFLRTLRNPNSALQDLQRMLRSDGSEENAFGKHYLRSLRSVGDDSEFGLSRSQRESGGGIHFLRSLKSNQEGSHFLRSLRGGPDSSQHFLRSLKSGSPNGLHFLRSLRSTGSGSHFLRTLKSGSDSGLHFLRPLRASDHGLHFLRTLRGSSGSHFLRSLRAPESGSSHFLRSLRSNSHFLRSLRSPNNDFGRYSIDDDESDIFDAPDYYDDNAE